MIRQDYCTSALGTTSLPRFLTDCTSAWGRTMRTKTRSSSSCFPPKMLPKSPPPLLPELELLLLERLLLPHPQPLLRPLLPRLLLRPPPLRRASTWQDVKAQRQEHGQGQDRDAGAHRGCNLDNDSYESDSRSPGEAFTWYYFSSPALCSCSDPC